MLIYSMYVILCIAELWRTLKRFYSVLLRSVSEEGEIAKLCFVGLIAKC